MSLGKQAKVLTKQQIDLLYTSLSLTQDEDRNRLIFLLSIRAGLRAKEIADLKWSMVMDADGCVGDQISLDNTASKGNSGRAIPLNKQLRGELVNHLTKASMKNKVADLHNERVIRTQRGKATSAQVIVNMFQGWYSRAGLLGCSSHSGRRTFITNAARLVHRAGGSLRDVQLLAGHRSIHTTERYIEGDGVAQRRLMRLL